MRKMTLAVATTALVVQAAIAQQAPAQGAEQGAHGTLVTLVAPYPQPEPGSPPGDRISLQYAVIEISRQEGLGYSFDLSQNNVGEVARRWVTPEIRQIPFTKAMDSLLLPLGLGYEVRNKSVVLVPKLVTLVAPYPKAYADAPTDKIDLQYAVMAIAQQAALGYDFDVSKKNVGEAARRWVTPNIQQVPFAKAMKNLLNPLGVGYEVLDGRVTLVPAKAR